MSKVKLDMAYATIRKMESQIHDLRVELSKSNERNNLAIEILKDSRLYHGASIDGRIDKFLSGDQDA